jgi:bifunctional non-homologous end joining protein LigD
MIGRTKNPAPKARKPPIKTTVRSARTYRSRNAVGRPNGSQSAKLSIPKGADDGVEVRVAERTVRLTNLNKPFWPDLRITKGDLLRYYLSIAEHLLPHLRNRAMVMKRYPNGAGGSFFFMKRAPSPRPEWIAVCTIPHRSGNLIDFPMIQDLAALLWAVNLGCIDLNPWYSRCDDVDRPDFLHFDLDPTPGASFAHVREAALVVHEILGRLKMPNFAKTSGSRGIHIYVPIKRGPLQKEVWTVAKTLARQLAAIRPKLLTAEYRVASRPPRHVLVDYNQNAWGRTLASIYSVRPRALPTVSAPVTWGEIEGGITVEDFEMGNMPARLAKEGDLWKPLLAERNRFRLEGAPNAT